MLIEETIFMQHKIWIEFIAVFSRYQKSFVKLKTNFIMSGSLSSNFKLSWQRDVIHEI